MLALKQVASRLRNILFRFEQYCAPDCGTFVQVEITDHAGEKSNFSGLLSDIELIAEVPGMVALELRLDPSANASDSA